jgi:hypothetical protein
LLTLDLMLYKYVTPDRIDVLESCLIRYTQPSALNDPFELRPFFDRLMTDEFLVEHLSGQSIDITQHVIEAYEEQPEEYKRQLSLDQYLAAVKAVVESKEGQLAIWNFLWYALRSLEQITPTLREQLPQQLGSKIGILSLTEVPDSLLMWAHYAANHSGFLLCFDENQVVYRDDLRFPALFELTGQEVFLTKRSEWAYEREWRVLAPLHLADKILDLKPDAIYLFHIPPDCIRGVIFGAKTADVVTAGVKALADSDSRYSHLDLQRARFVNETAGIEIVSGYDTQPLNRATAPDKRLQTGFGH